MSAKYLGRHVRALTRGEQSMLLAALAMLRKAYLAKEDSQCLDYANRLGKLATLIGNTSTIAVRSYHDQTDAAFEPITSNTSKEARQD